MTIATLFRSNGLKVTPQRRVVYNVLSNLCHASVEEIVEEVARQNPDITVATIYNILDCFATNNVISRLSTPQGKLFYDITPAQHHHIIGQTGNILDYNSGELDSLLHNHFAAHPIVGQKIERLTLQIFTTDNTQN